MSLDAPTADKMIKAAPAKKGYHFPSDGVHLAEYVEAATLEEATAIYHQVKRLLHSSSTAAPIAPVEEPSSPPAPADLPNDTK